MTRASTIRRMRILLRLLWLYLTSRWRTPVGVHDTLVLQRRVAVTALDLNLHMNHASYLSVVEHGLLEALMRTGFLGSMLSQKTVPMIGGTLISYRRELRPLQAYCLHLRYLGAEPHWHVFAFCFVDQQGQVLALGQVKGAAVKRQGKRALMSTQATWDAHARRHPGLPPMPELAPEAIAWLQAERLIYTAHAPKPTAPSAAVR
jgi:acyl-CoA thioesterase FadM